jgi:hypothetical protein
MSVCLSVCSLANTCRLWIPEHKAKSAKDSSENSDGEEDDNSVFTPVELLSSDLPLPELSGTWRPKYKIPMRSLTVLNTSHSNVYFRFDKDGLKQKREIGFASSQEASDFVSAFKREQARESKRQDAKLKGSLGNIQLTRGEKLDLLIEIVSGWNLPIADLSSSDPFVICSINGSEVHRTKYVPKS